MSCLRKLGGYMKKIEKKWAELLKNEYEKPYYIELIKEVEQEYLNEIIYPPQDELFQAFTHTAPEDVKVVILGQDPYHDEGQAEGLCFSVKEGMPFPPSLRNIFKELQEDTGCEMPISGSLIPWAKQGVLLLNTVLTVRAHQANSHQGIGWELFTDAVIEAMNQQNRPIVFILWGKPAGSKKKMLTNSNHLILEAPHPSPLSSYRGFFGSKPFTKTNEFLVSKGVAPINFSLQ